MLAELTHRCPLACPYCSNPQELVRMNEELSTSEWIETFRQAAALGVLHLHLSGGEPASRRDLVELTEAAVSFGLYTNLITSGVGLTEARVDNLSAAGLDHVQLSIQGTKAASADHVSGYDGGFTRKMAVAGWLRQAGIPLTLNAVCHRRNMDEIEDIVSRAVVLGARRVEIARVQFHGWAMLNQQALMPTMARVSKATKIVETMRARL
jgi:pyrroloquinoline quinone biosynthesis protein E